MYKNLDIQLYIRTYEKTHVPPAPTPQTHTCKHTTDTLINTCRYTQTQTHIYKHTYAINALTRHITSFTSIRKCRWLTITKTYKLLLQIFINRLTDTVSQNASPFQFCWECAATRVLAITQYSLTPKTLNFKKYNDKVISIILGGEHSVLEWVSICVRISEWKCTFSELTESLRSLS